MVGVAQNRYAQVRQEPANRITASANLIAGEPRL